MVDRTRIIAIVDDDPSQHRLLGGLVESLGFRAETMASAEELLQRLAQNRPDVILLDVRLPGRSGLDALPDIRQLAPGVPVLLITAHADVRQAVEAVKGGADDYLPKPLDLDELETAILD
ncbi:MAG TPA: response regulator, partial [Planctomycetaceae bacterium]|nr:response regulator [Planctomycetaceae bacterium]